MVELEIDPNDKKAKKKEKKDKKNEGDEQVGPPKDMFEDLQTYVYVRFAVDPPVVAKFLQKQPTLKDIIPKFVEPIPPPIEEVVVKEFKAQLVIVIESLAMEYVSSFGRKMRIISMNSAQ